MGQASIITGPQRRRVFDQDQKLALLSAAFGSGGNVAEVARRADICTSLLYRWRQAYAAARSGPAFIPAIVEGRPDRRDNDAVILVELAGTTVRIAAGASATLVTAALRALR